MDSPAARSPVLFSMPEKGTVCVIQIDPVKTLEETGDKALALSARSLPAGKYLACITDVRVLVFRLFSSR